MKGTGVVMKLMEWASRRRGEAVARKREVAQGRIFACAFCRGTGILQRSKGIRCPVCRGEGSVDVDPPVIICAYCGGKGESNPRTNITCIVCRGKGVVPVKEPFTECRQCRGTGVEANGKLPCLACRGKGVTAMARS